MIRQIQKKRKLAILLSLILAAVFALPVNALGQKSGIIRVGWYESPFNSTDPLGRRSGYAYDYQQKIAAYSGWTYEYVEGSWSDLLQMLSDGKIDLMSDVAFTDERAQSMLFSSLPMGAEEYYLFVSPENNEINSEDYSTFNGKRVGANRNSVQIGLFREWAKANGIQAEIVELTGNENDNIAKLTRGEIDMYLSLDGFFDKDSAVPVCKIGASDFYFAISKSRHELLAELNKAMSRIRDENPLYHQLLYSKYLRISGLNQYLSAEENEWVAKHGPIRVGYQDNYLAFCARDPKSGELTGALKDYLAVASDCLENAHLDFEPVCFPTSADAMNALKNGEVDCVFPANLTDYDGEIRGVYITPALMRTDMSAVIRESDQKTFSKKDRVAVAVNADNPNYDMFLLDHFPDWRTIYYADTPECLRAISEGQADCLLISNYRYNNISKLCEKYHLTTLSTGVEMDYCFAVNREDTVLYSILAKAAGVVPATTVNAALTRYFIEDSRTGITDLFRQNLTIAVIALTVIILVLLVLLFLLLRSTRRKKKVGEKTRPIPRAEDFRFLDDLPVSYSVYHVTHAEHSKLYDAQIVYVNHKYEELGGLPSEAILGHRIRELYPHIGENWYVNVKSAACDGTPVEYDYVDELSGKRYHFSARQIIQADYCAVTYVEA